MKKMAARSSRKLPGPAGRMEQAGRQPAGELLDMEQAIGLLKTTRPTFYRWLRAGKLKGSKAGRQWRFQKGDVERFLRGEGPQVDLPVGIKPLIAALRDRLREKGSPAEGAEADLVVAVKLMIRLAAKMSATDLHLEPQPADISLLRYRVDGVMHHMVDIDTRLLPAIIAQWKMMAGCNARESLRPQEGRVVLDGGEGGSRLEARVMFLPTMSGEALSATLLDSSAARLNLRQLGFSPAVMKRIERWIPAPWGTVIFTGPAGCGKTSSLYACLAQIAAGPARPKIMTVEADQEYPVAGVTQVLVHGTAGMTFGSGLRAVLRSSPDVVMAGEIPDLETLVLSLQGALTGHLMFISLHTNEAASALLRMVDVGANPLTVTESIKLIVAQRLVRALCSKCALAAKPAEPQLNLARKLAAIGGFAWDSPPEKFRGPVGCKECNQTGYRGRIVIAEALEVSSRIASAVTRGGTISDLRAIAVSEGMITLAADGMRCAAEGRTSLAEILKTVGNIYGVDTMGGAK